MSIAEREEAEEGNTGAGPVKASTFASLRVPLFRILWIGGVFSFLSVQMQFMVRGFLAYELTGTNSSLGTVYMWFGIPMLLASPFGGVVADRLGKRRVIIGGQLLIVAISGSIGFALLADVLEFWMLAASAFFQGVAFAFFGPARVAFTTQLAGREHLGNAMVLSQMALNGTRTFGPALAGALVGVALIGAKGVYFISAGLMLASLLVTLKLPAGAPTGPASDKRPVADLVDGLRYVRGRPRLLLLMVTSFVVVMAGFPYFAFFPSLVGDVYGVLEEGRRARFIGNLSSTQAIGAVAATLIVAKRASGLNVWLEQILWGAAFGGSLLLLAASPTYWVALVAVAAAGAASSGFQSLNNALVMTIADDEYHGRVQSLMMIAFGGFALATKPVGIVADHVGLPETLAGMGLVVILTLVVCRLAWSRVPEVRASGTEPALASDR